MTCPIQKKDALFYVLYGANIENITGMIEECVLNIADEYTQEGVKDALQLMRPSPGDSLNKLRAKFFLLLNEDEKMRKQLGNVKSTLMVSLCPRKAELFYDSLCDELIPTWIKDEKIPLEAFIDSLRASYLVC